MRLTTYLVLLWITVLFLQTNSVLAQQTTTDNTPEPIGTTDTAPTPQQEAVIKDVAQQQSLPLDTVTIGGVIATAGGLLLNDRREKKKLEEKMSVQELEVRRKEEELRQKNQEIVEIVMALEVINYKIFNSAYLYKTLTFKDILDLKSTNNPLEKNTLGEEYAIQINKLAKFTVVNYNMPMPNMSIPSAQVIGASTVKQEVKEAVAKAETSTVQHPSSTAPTG